MADRMMVYLGESEYDRRKAALEEIAERVGADGQRGPSVSVLVQMLADRELDVELAPIERRIGHVEYVSGDLFYSGDWDGVNEDASETRYMEMVEEAIRDYFNDDDAEPETTVEATATGYDGKTTIRFYDRRDNLLYPEEDRELEELWHEVNEIAGDVFNGQGWLIFDEDFPSAEELDAEGM